MNFTPNIKEISRLRHLAKEYYNKIFKIKYSPTTLPPTTPFFIFFLTAKETKINIHPTDINIIEI